jgi:hypothetical protein
MTPDRACRLPRQQSVCAALRLLRLVARRDLFEGKDRDRTFATKPLEIEARDELGQRRLPRLLPVIIEFAELVRVHAQFARHLQVRVRKAVTPARLRSRQEFLRKFRG